MKTRFSSWRNRQLKLHIDEPGVPKSEQAVVAVAELHEGLSAWVIMDVRLGQYARPGPYFNVGADGFWAKWTAKDDVEAGFVRAQLRETFPPQSAAPLEVEWCTFDGIVRGKAPDELGVAKHIVNPAAVLHRYRAVRSYFEQLQTFWAAWPHSERDPDIRAKVSAVKIPNQWRQPSAAAVSAALLAKRLETTGGTMHVDVTAPAMGRIWWCADNLAEATRWQSEYTAKGAVVELKPDDDRPIVDVIISLERAKSREILGYDVQDHEWLVEEDEPTQECRPLGERNA